MASNVYLCRVTDCNYRLFSAKALISHMSLSHVGGDVSEFMCNVDSCARIYCSVEAYRKHLSRDHSDHWNSTREEESPSTTNVDSFDTCSNNCADSDITEMDWCDESTPTYAEFSNTMAKKMIFARLKTREMHMLPKSVASCINDDYSCILDTFQSGMQEIIRCRLLAMGVEYETDPVLAEILNAQSLVDNVNVLTSSDHLLMKYCKGNMNFIEPVPVYVYDHDRITVGHYVPILPNITHYLQHDDVWCSFQKARGVNSTYMYDYVDGDFWRTSGLAADHIRIHLYSDEFEVCNPLGSRRGVHKICAFYYTIGNVGVEHRSRLKNIQLAMLIKYRCLKKYGYKQIMEPLISDLQMLESNGIVVHVDDQQIGLKGSVVTVSGDNLSLHGIGGFNPTFSAGRICRHCLTPYSQICDTKCEEDCTLRTPECHNYHVKSVLNDCDLKPVYGVYDECPLSVLSFFHPVLCLPPDIMHDVLEGVMIFSVDGVIKKLVRSRVIPMSGVCDSMRSFVYGQSDITDKPQPLPEDYVRRNKSLSGKAAENFCLFRLLPLYIGHLVPENHPVWLAYLTLRMICDLILAPVINRDDMGYLELLIVQYFQMLSDIGTTHFPPKLHYLIHYPRLMLHFGPLRHLWSMRFEATHQYFKQVAKRARNMLNITLTLAERYQMRQCYDRAGNNCLGNSVTCPESQKIVCVKSLPMQLQQVLLSKYGLADDVQCNSLKWLVFAGNKIFLNGLLLLHCPDDGLPVFLRIKAILNCRGIWIICGSLVVSTQFLQHYHAFVLSDSDEWMAVVPQEAVINHPVINSYTVDCKQLAVLRFAE